MQQLASHTFELELGALLRSRVMFELKKGAVRYGVEFTYEERKGFFDSDYICTVRGEHSRVRAYLRACNEYFEVIR